jgi:hypothetical protein
MPYLFVLRALTPGQERGLCYNFGQKRIPAKLETYS